MTLEKNMGIADRIIRPAIAARIITAYAAGKLKGGLGIALLTLSGFFLATSTAGSCPEYEALDIDTVAD